MKWNLRNTNSFQLKRKCFSYAKEKSTLVAGAHLKIQFSTEVKILEFQSYLIRHYYGNLS